MTIKAIMTLKQQSSSAYIAVIIPPDILLDGINVQVSNSLGGNMNNIIFKSGGTHFDNWNPTQVYLFFFVSFF
jgi:hypothetical protein